MRTYFTRSINSLNPRTSWYNQCFWRNKKGRPGESFCSWHGWMIRHLCRGYHWNNETTYSTICRCPRLEWILRYFWKRNHPKAATASTHKQCFFVCPSIILSKHRERVLIIRHTDHSDHRPKDDNTLSMLKQACKIKCATVGICIYIFILRFPALDTSIYAWIFSCRL